MLPWLPGVSRQGSTQQRSQGRTPPPRGSHRSRGQGSTPQAQGSKLARLVGGLLAQSQTRGRTAQLSSPWMLRQEAASWTFQVGRTRELEPLRRLRTELSPGLSLSQMAPIVLWQAMPRIPAAHQAAAQQMLLSARPGHHTAAQQTMMLWRSRSGAAGNLGCLLATAAVSLVMSHGTRAERLQTRAGSRQAAGVRLAVILEGATAVQSCLEVTPSRGSLVLSIRRRGDCLPMQLLQHRSHSPQQALLHPACLAQAAAAATPVWQSMA